jgi:hypothetical protein
MNLESDHKMKRLRKLIMSLAVLTTCLPASADILIYKKALKCWSSYSLGGDLWDIDKSSTKGFFVLEVNYNPDGTLAEVVGSAQIEYWRDREEGKLYEVYEHGFDIIRVAEKNSITWVLVEEIIDDGDALLVILKGKAGNTNIGSVTNNEAAKRISGDQLLCWDGGDWIGTCTWSLRMYKKWTHWSNQDGNDLNAAVNNIEAWLVSKGYQED